MNAQDYQKLLDAGFTIIRRDRTAKNIMHLAPVPNPDPATGRGGLSWQKHRGPFAHQASMAATMKELLKDSKTIEG